MSLGLDSRTCLREVLLRISSESGITRLTPQGWKQHFALDAVDHDEADSSPGLVHRGRVREDRIHPVFPSRVSGAVDLVELLKA